MTDPTDLTPAEQAAAEYLWSQSGGEDYDPENGGHARAVADHADMARDIVALVRPLIMSEATTKEH